MLKLSIRTKCKEGQVPLYTKMKINGVSLWVNLQLVVDIEKWNEVSLSERKQSNFLDKIGYTKKLSEIEFGIKDLRARHRLTKESLDDVIRTVVFSEIREQFIKDEELGKVVQERKRKDVKNFVKNYVDGIIKGEILNKKGQPYSKNSVNSWKQFRDRFLECYKHVSFTWDELDQRLIHMFLNYLTKQGYMGETISRHIGVYSTIISISELQGLHNNSKVRKWLTAPTLSDEDRRKQIFLTREELQALYNMPLTGTEEKVRDLFLIGCFTGQRFSDYHRIDENNIGYTKNGTKVIRLFQQKTKCQVVIPILNDELEVLLKKYNYCVPSISEQKLNDHIKEICRRLSETVPSLAQIERTLLTKTEREMEQNEKVEYHRDGQGNVIKYRWEMVASHTARRTMVTNMYLSRNVDNSRRFSLQQIMTVSGHKKEETLKRYLKLSLDEFADDVARTGLDGLF